MIKGDPGAESVFLWTKDKKNVNRRGAGPMDASIYGRGAGEGFGVHICTGPVEVRGAEPGDVLEVRIIDVKPRGCFNPAYKGKAFGSNAAAWWGFQYNDLLTDPKPREVITIYELDASGDKNWAMAVYNFQWVTPDRSVRGRPQDHRLPGVPVDHSLVKENHGDFEKSAGSGPPAFRGYRGGAKGGRDRRLDPARLFRRQYGQLAGRQGCDAILPGRRARCAIFGRRSARLSRRFRTVRHGDRMFADRHVPTRSAQEARLLGTALADLQYPLLETQDEWVAHGFSYPNYLAQLGDKAQSEIYSKSSIDLAMRDAFRKMRHFLMTTKGCPRTRQSR